MILPIEASLGSLAHDHGHSIGTRTFTQVAAHLAKTVRVPPIPQLTGLEVTLTETTPEVLAEADLVFLALPHGESAGAPACGPP